MGMAIDASCPPGNDWSGFGGSHIPPFCCCCCCCCDGSGALEEASSKGGLAFGTCVAVDPGCELAVSNSLSCAASIAALAATCPQVSLVMLVIPKLFRPRFIRSAICGMPDAPITSWVDWTSRGLRSGAVLGPDSSPACIFLDAESGMYTCDIFCQFFGLGVKMDTASIEKDGHRRNGT